jgi:hypothetical protein
MAFPGLGASASASTWGKIDSLALGHHHISSTKVTVSSRSSNRCLTAPGGIGDLNL